MLFQMKILAACFAAIGETISNLFRIFYVFFNACWSNIFLGFVAMLFGVEQITLYFKIYNSFFDNNVMSVLLSCYIGHLYNKHHGSILKYTAVEI